MALFLEIVGAAGFLPRRGEREIKETHGHTCRNFGWRHERKCGRIPQPGASLVSSVGNLLGRDRRAHGFKIEHRLPSASGTALATGTFIWKDIRGWVGAFPGPA